MRAPPQPYPLLGGEYGDHVLVEQVVEGHRLVAVRARAADVDTAGEDAAGRAALVTEETVLAAGALIDGEVASWPGRRPSSPGLSSPSSGAGRWRTSTRSGWWCAGAPSVRRGSRRTPATRRCRR